MEGQNLKKKKRKHETFLKIPTAGGNVGPHMRRETFRDWCESRHYRQSQVPQPKRGRKTHTHKMQSCLLLIETSKTSKSPLKDKMKRRTNYEQKIAGQNVF